MNDPKSPVHSAPSGVNAGYAPSSTQGNEYAQQGLYKPLGEYKPPGTNPPQPYPPQIGFAPHPEVSPPLIQGSSYNSTQYLDPENPGFDEAKGFGFSDESIRKGFIKKVYSILSIQLLLSGAMIALFLLHRPTNLWVNRNPIIGIIAFVVLFAVVIPMSCSEDLRRKSPTNFILLGIFTLAQAFLLGAASGRYQAEEVLLAVAITAAVCIGLTIFAFQTRFDFTVLGGILFVSLIILILFGIIAMFFPGRTIKLVYASVGALIFCVYLIYDTQIMMGGSHKYSISPEEYIFAALNLYLDIINIFMYILMIIGIGRD